MNELIYQVTTTRVEDTLATWVNVIDAKKLRAAQFGCTAKERSGMWEVKITQGGEVLLDTTVSFPLAVRTKELLFCQLTPLQKILYSYLAVILIDIWQKQEWQEHYVYRFSLGVPVDPEDEQLLTPLMTFGVMDISRN